MEHLEAPGKKQKKKVSKSRSGFELILNSFPNFQTDINDIYRFSKETLEMVGVKK